MAKEEEKKYSETNFWKLPDQYDVNDLLDDFDDEPQKDSSAEKEIQDKKDDQDKQWKFVIKILFPEYSIK